MIPKEYKRPIQFLFFSGQAQNVRLNEDLTTGKVYIGKNGTPQTLLHRQAWPDHPSTPLLL